MFWLLAPPAAADLDRHHARTCCSTATASRCSAAASRILPQFHAVERAWTIAGFVALPFMLVAADTVDRRDGQRSRTTGAPRNADGVLVVRRAARAAQYCGRCGADFAGRAPTGRTASISARAARRCTGARRTRFAHCCRSCSRRSGTWTRSRRTAGAGSRSSRSWACSRSRWSRCCSAPRYGAASGDRRSTSRRCGRCSSARRFTARALSWRKRSSTYFGTTIVSACRCCGIALAMNIERCATRSSTRRAC